MLQIKVPVQNKHYINSLPAGILRTQSRPDISIKIPTGNAPQKLVNTRRNSRNSPPVNIPRTQIRQHISVEIPTGNTPQQPPSQGLINQGPQCNSHTHEEDIRSHTMFTYEHKGSSGNQTGNQPRVIPTRSPWHDNQRANSSKYKVYYTNIDCLTVTKHKELCMITETHDPDILVITEMESKNPNRKLQECEIQLQGYTAFHNLETGPRGVCIYIRDTLNPNESEIRPDFEESVWVEIKEKATEKTLIGCVYRSPNGSDENNNKLNSFISEIGNKKQTNLILIGDFNYPKIKWNDEGFGVTEDKKSEEFLESTRKAYLLQHITEPTRHRIGQRSNTLDLLFTYEEVIDDIQYIPPVGKSDHCSLLFNVNRTNTATGKQAKKVYKYNKANYEEMRKDIRNIRWEDQITTLEEGWKLIKQSINEAIDKHVPTQIIDPTKRRRPLWMSLNCLSKVRKKHAAWKRYLETKSGEDYLKYTRARNQSRTATRKAQRDHESSLAKEVKKNPKLFWKYVHSKTKVKNTIPDIKIPGTNMKTTSDEEKAEVFNKYFKEVFTKEDEENIPDVPPKEVESILREIIITEDDVLKKLKSMNPNKSAGPDQIPPRILKELSEVLAKPLTILFKLSLQSGKLPEEWKTANVTPIYKKGGKSKAENYRPVSLTVIICRMLESLLLKVIIDHLMKHDFISKNQHGFLPKRSTVTQLLATLEIWTKELDKGNSMHILYCDFRKAFDSVPHKRLINKIRSMGIDGPVLMWIEDFLKGRRQRVCVNGNFSTWEEVTSGVPQGSVLGPLLFVIFINDLEDAVGCGIQLYADDTKIYAVVNNDEDSEEFQKQINSLFQWSATWQLQFHPDKCHILKIGPNKDENYKYTLGTDNNQTNLENSTEEKDLGVIIDSKLNFSGHCNKIIGKANKLLGILRRNFCYINNTNFNYLYKGIIRPIIEYAAPVYNPVFMKDVQSIESIQRRATKMVLGLENKSYEERLRELKLPTLIYRRARGDMIQVYKYLHDLNQCPEEMLALARPGMTRGHPLKLQKDHFRLQTRGHSFSQRVINMWNHLKEETVMASSINAFKNKLDAEWDCKEFKYNRRAPAE